MKTRPVNLREKRLLGCEGVLFATGVFLLTSCHSVLPHKLGGNPANLPAGASAAQVRREMGEPTAVTALSGDRGEIWHYADYWWEKPGWANRWGTWNLAMNRLPDRGLRLQGWQLADPPGQEGRAAFPGRAAATPADRTAGSRVPASSVRHVQHPPLER